MHVLAIGDTHAPYHNPATFDFLADLKREYKPDVVVHIGDLGDQYGWSRHGDRMPDSPGQSEEDAQTLKFCKQLYKLFPKVRACVGNHDTRLAKAIVRAGVPSRLHATIKQIYLSPRGWKWESAFKLDGVVYTHGEGFSGPNAAIMAARLFASSCVIGHVHSVGGVRYWSSVLSSEFGCSTGCLVDPDGFGMAYAKQFSAKPVLGSAVVIDGVPQFIPLGSS
jgi:predicted phosphodiesterase